MAWVLSYLVVSTGFQLPDIASNAEATSHSPLAKFVHNSQSYSLRFSAGKLSEHNKEQPTDGDLFGLIPVALRFADDSVLTVNTPSAVLVSKAKKWVKPSPRGPPSILS